MAICEYCSEQLFHVPWLPGEGQRDHHATLDGWTKSVEAACTICTLLFEHFKTAIQTIKKDTTFKKDDKRPSKLEKHAELNTSVDHLQDGKERDRYTQTISSETMLLDWANRDRALLDIKLPVYQARIQDAGGREAWTLKFQPRSGLLVAKDPLNLTKQSFFVYAADCRYCVWTPGAHATWLTEVYNTDDGSPESNVNLAESTKSTTTFEQIRQWIQLCEMNHKKCKSLHEERPHDAWVPTRLIDVGTPDSPVLRLVETENKADSTYDNYKWGCDPSYLLEEGTLHEFLNQIELEKMPQTFQDAVYATRALGVRYLWIDALCLLQKDEEDWLREAPKMQEVYGNSYLSLAAVSADNCEQGLFRQRTSSGAPPSVTSVNWGCRDTKSVVIREDFWKGEVLSEPLYTRGWVLQERMLAPRILHFQRRQVLWQCPSLTACEAIPKGLSLVVDDERKYELRWRQLFHRQKSSELSKDDRADLQEVWRLAVQNYTSCNLTKNGDKLMAIAGIAKKMQSEFRLPPDNREERYLAGLWEHLLAEQLAWRVVKWREAKHEPSYRAPSWSWASVDGIVQVPARITTKRKYIMKIEPEGVNLPLAKVDNPTGSILFASLTVEVELYWPLKFFSPQRNAVDWTWTGAEHAWCRLYLDWPVDTYSPSEDVNVKEDPSDESSGYQLECRAAMVAYERDLASYDSGIPTYTGFALALKSGNAGQASVFCRLGLIEFRNLTGDGWEALQNARVSRAQKKDEVAPSNDRVKDKHVITLL
ncbi:MAG: hypothetical protein M1822_005405 [Bathelium mastoideum]|nr:MAG: hypothetical protein M1822_005405 [Bathelium mastoideum]